MIALYYAMKLAAIQRHIALRKLEGDPTGNLQGTWHERVIALVYPV